MGEIVIPAKFNAHKIYKKMMFLNPYRNAGGGGGTDLIFTIDTSLGDGVNGFTIQTVESTSYDADWGDGVITSGHTGDASHIYTNGGIYQIKVSGTLPRPYNTIEDNARKIVSIDNWGNMGYSTNLTKMYQFCHNLVSIAEDAEFLNSVISGYAMFQRCQLTTLPEIVKFSSLARGNYLLTFGKINTPRYSQLLIDINDTNPNNDVLLRMEKSKYNTAGETARNALIARGWTFNDGGLE